MDTARLLNNLPEKAKQAKAQNSAFFKRLKKKRPKDLDTVVHDLHNKVFKEMPCPFLMADNYCMVYEYRPKACREYPHTDRKRFYQALNVTLKNCATCPAVFEITERLKSIY